MRSLWIVAALVGPAAADELSQLRDAVRDPGGAAFATSVIVELPIATPTCGKLAGAIARDKLLPCLRAAAGAGGLDVYRSAGAKEPVLALDHHVVLAIQRKGDRIIALGPVAPSSTERARVTTDAAVFVTFRPSPQLAKELDKQTDVVTAVHKVCFDERGKITSRRLLVPSPLAAFDMETTATVAALAAQPPFKPYGAAIATCDLVRIDFPDGEMAR